MSFCDPSNLIWEIRPYCDEDIELSKQLVSGQLTWGELISLDRYKAEEPISCLSSESFLLQIGFGWTRFVPISSDSSDLSSGQFGLLLASSFFSNFDYKAIISRSQQISPLGLKRKNIQSSASLFESLTKTSDTNRPPSVNNSLSDCNDLLVKKTKKLPDNNSSFKSTSRKSVSANLFPKKLILEFDSGDSPHDLYSLRELVNGYWDNKGFASSTAFGKGICQTASDLFILMHSPSCGPFVFPYNLENGLKFLMDEAISRLKDVPKPSVTRSIETLVDGYVFATCYSHVRHESFGETLEKKHNLHKRWLYRQYHIYSKLIKIWGKKAPLARMDPAVINKMLTLKAPQIDELNIALDLLFKELQKEC